VVTRIHIDARCNSISNKTFIPLSVFPGRFCCIGLEIDWLCRRIVITGVFAHIFIVLLSLVALEIRDISLGWEEIRARNVTDSFWNVFFGYISRDGKAFGSILMAGKHSLIVFCSWCWKGVMERSIVLIS
jgi:hypothetical protein